MTFRDAKRRSSESSFPTSLALFGLFALLEVVGTSTGAARARPVAARQPLEASAQGAHVEGSVGGDALHAAAAFGDYALAGYGLALRVFDISRPEEPGLAGSIRLPGPALGIATGQQVAYVAAGPAGLLVVDLSEPARPVLAAEITSLAPAGGVAMRGDQVLVTVGDALVILDVTPDSGSGVAWSEVGRAILTGPGHGVTVMGDRAHVAVSPAEPLQGLTPLGRLDTVDIATPAQPRLVASLPLAWPAVVVAMQGSYAYVGTRGSECDGCSETGHVVVVDVGRPEAPAQQGVLTPGLIVTALAPVDGFLYATTQGSLMVVDVADPLNPLVVSSLNSPGGAGGLAVGNDWIFLPGRLGQVLEKGDPGKPRALGMVTGWAGEAVIRGSTAYLASADFVTVDLRDPARPRPVGRLTLGGHALHVAAGDGRAYVLSRAGLTVVDVGDPARPVALGTVPLDCCGSALAAAGVTALVAVAGDGNGLNVINAADPNSPVSAATLSLPGYVKDIALARTTAVVAADRGGLQVVDVSDPAQPRWTATFDTGTAFQRVALSGQMALATDHDSLWIVDISQLDRPREVAHLALPRPSYVNDVAAEGQLVAVKSSSEIIVLNIADPARPVILDHWGPADGNDVAFGGGLLGLAGTNFRVLEMGEPTALRQPGAVGIPARWPAKSLTLSGSVGIAGDYSYDIHRVEVTAGGDLYDPEWIGQNVVVASVLSGELLHVANGHYDYEVFRLGDLVDPSVSLGSASLRQRPNHIHLQAGFAYVSGWDDDFFAFSILDVRRPEAIRLIDTLVGSSVDDPSGYVGFGGGLEVRDGLAYVADLHAGLLVIDVHDPAQPVQIGALGTRAVGLDVALRGDLAYLAARGGGPNQYDRRGGYSNQSAGVLVVDISDPSKPRRIGQVDSSGEAPALDLTRDRLYLADGTGGLRVYDVSTAAAPRDIGGVDLGPGSNVLEVHVAGSRAYLAAGSAGVVAVDLGPDLAPTRGGVNVFLPALEVGR